MPAAYTPDPIVSAEDLQAIHPPPQDPTTWAKFSRKFKEEPLVPLGRSYTPPPLAVTSPNRTDGQTDRSLDARRAATGCLATVAALLGASSALQKGNRTQFNMFLRYRVAAQGLTLIAALGAANFMGSRTGGDLGSKSADLETSLIPLLRFRTGGSVYYGAQRRAQREADRAAKAAAAAASASPTLA